MALSLAMIYYFQSLNTHRGKIQFILTQLPRDKMAPI